MVSIPFPWPSMQHGRKLLAEEVFHFHPFNWGLYDLRGSVIARFCSLVLWFCSFTCILMQSLKSKIQAGEMRVLFLILGETRRDRRHNVGIRKQLDIIPLIIDIDMATNRQTQQILYWVQIEDQYCSGKIKISDIISWEFNIEQADILCKDHVTWKGYLKQVSTDRLQ